MSNLTTTTKEEKNLLTPEQNKTGIESHKTAAKHHEEAAKNHHEAAKHYEAGDHQKAAQSTITAQGHHTLATEAMKEHSKNLALISKK